MTDHAAAQILCRALDWDWSDDAQRKVCIEAAEEVARAEREACAMIADDVAAEYEDGDAANVEARQIAASIRKRGHAQTFTSSSVVSRSFTPPCKSNVV